MSAYGLIKATSRIMRSDTIADLYVVNKWRREIGLQPVSSTGPSVRRLENCVALALEGQDLTTLPKLVRGDEFYLSILPEITEQERKYFHKINPLTTPK